MIQNQRMAYDIDQLDMMSADDIQIGTTEPTASPFPASISDILASIATKGSYLHAFIASLAVIIVSELGDKTFFIAAILAMKNSRLWVFIAAMLALGIMTILASMMGIASTIIPKVYIHYASITLFIIFGLKMLKEGFEMSDSEAREEMQTVKSDIEQREQAANQTSNGTLSSQDPETGVIKSSPNVAICTKLKRKFLAFVSLAFIKTFTMIFVAEWGDRSQISTMVLAACENPIAVTIGALLGHALCTGLAVLGGRFIAQMISVKTVTIIGGFTFLIFAGAALIYGSN